MYGGFALRVASISLLAGALIAGSAVSAHAAPKASEGASCKKLEATTTIRSGKGRKAKTQNLVCLPLLDGQRWVEYTPTPTTGKKATAIWRTWSTLTSPESLADLSAVPTLTAEAVAADLAPAVAARDEWAAKLNEATGRKNALVAESQSLPGRMQAANDATLAAKNAHAEAVTVAERELGTLNRLYPEYSSAMDALYAGLAPGIGCSFGFTEYCAEAAAANALRPWANGVVARYEAQARVADAATAHMGAKYKEWEARYAEWEALSNRNNAVGGEIQQATQDEQHATNMLLNATSEADKLNERVQLLPQLQSLHAQMLDRQREFASRAANKKITQTRTTDRVEILKMEGLALEASYRQLMETWARFVN